MLILGLDFETTGLDVKTLDVIEIGACLWDTKRRAPVSVFNALVRGATVPQEITDLTGITQADSDGGWPTESAFQWVSSMMVKADAVCAHNGTNFDRPIYERLKQPGLGDRNDQPWIDTSVDIAYPKHITTRKLAHLAAEHGFANPFSHRALFDVMTMLKILDMYTLEPILWSAKLPAIEVEALVSYADREKAKARGYRWDSARRIWFKTMKEPALEAERAECGFETRILAVAHG